MEVLCLLPGEIVDPGKGDRVLIIRPKETPRALWAFVPPEVVCLPQTVNRLGVSLGRSVYRAYERQESIVSIATREKASKWE